MAQDSGTQTANDPAAVNHSPSMEQFAQNLLDEKDLNSIDDVTKEAMRDDLVDRLEQVTNRVIVDNLPKDKLAEFEKMIDTDAEPDDVQEFVSQNVPKLESKLADAYFDFRRLYLGL